MRYQFMRYPGGKSKAFTMSYDDGSRSDLRFSDTITKYGLKCTFNLNSNVLRHGLLSDDTIREIVLDRGHEIAVHGEMHRAPGLIRPVEGIRDVLNCRIELEQRFGCIIRGYAYPDSGITKWTETSDYPTVKQYLTDLDIVYARTLKGDNDSFALPVDWHAWTPTAHHVNPEILDYLDRFLAVDTSEKVYEANREPRLFYLWGHSFEFDRNHNWELLDTICQKIACKEDVWYATNMEIYDYVTAYRSLRYSADGTRVYNPTLLTLYFIRDGVEYVLRSGETVVLPA